jgi:predicted Holliday junction resolvase-like endonuclease
MRTWLKLVIIFIAVVSVLASLMCYMIRKPAPLIRSEMEETDAAVERLDTRAAEFNAEVKEHKTQTERTVRVIRETVQRDIRQLDLDGLAVAALGEIELWRGSSGGSIDPRPSRLDGD